MGHRTCVAKCLLRPAGLGVLEPNGSQQGCCQPKLRGFRVACKTNHRPEASLQVEGSRTVAALQKKLLGRRCFALHRQTAAAERALCHTLAPTLKSFVSLSTFFHHSLKRRANKRQRIIHSHPGACPDFRGS